MYAQYAVLFGRAALRAAQACAHISFAPRSDQSDTHAKVLYIFISCSSFVFLPFNKYMPVGVKWLAARPSFAPSDNRCYLNHAGR